MKEQGRCCETMVIKQAQATPIINYGSAYRAETCMYTHIWVIFCARPHNLCAARASHFPRTLKQSARVKIIKFGCALGEVVRVSFSVFVFTAALSARHTEHKKRFEKMGPLPVLSRWRRRRPLKEKEMLPSQCAAHPTEPTPAAQEGWNAFENGFVGADSHSAHRHTNSQKNSSPFSSLDNLHSKSPLYTENHSQEFLWSSAWVFDPKFRSCLTFLMTFLQRVCFLLKNGKRNVQVSRRQNNILKLPQW